MSGTRSTPSRTTSAPTPFGPPNLCPERDTSCAHSVVSRTESHGTPWIASVWSAACGAARCTRSAIAPSGWTMPVSLLTSITETTAVRASSAAAKASRSTTPSAPASIGRTRKPSPSSRAHAPSTALCSIAVVTIPSAPFESRAARAVPFTARLSLSVPPPVNTTSRGSHPQARATASRASSSADFAARAAACIPDGFAK